MILNVIKAVVKTIVISEAHHVVVKKVIPKIKQKVRDIREEGKIKDGEVVSPSSEHVYSQINWEEE